MTPLPTIPNQPLEMPKPSTLPQPLTAKFKIYLQKQGLTPATLKNYVSDVDQFLTWLGRNLQEDKLEARQLTQTAFSDYARVLADPVNQVHPATANRYLSSLRSFGQFLVSQNLASANPALKLKNQTADPTLNQLLNEFRRELNRQKLSASTVKNYLSDIKNYLVWARANIKKTDNKLNLL